MTWEFRVLPGGRIRRFIGEEGRVELRPGEVQLEFLAGGICGSDIGTLLELSTDAAASHLPIVPIHEVVGLVRASRDNRFAEGQIAVGTCLTGLASTLVERGDHLIPAPPGLSVSDAIAIQPVSTVLRAARTLPPVKDSHVVVLGAGAIGLAFLHVLADMGAGRVTAVDTVAARESLVRKYGADDFVGCSGEQWAEGVRAGGERPHIVIDAVGRRPALIAGALRAVADGGYVLGFGSATTGDYCIPFSEMYHRRLTLASGRTRERWKDVLGEGAEYVLQHATVFAGYVTSRVPVDMAEVAYRHCAEQDATRVKVALVDTASQLGLPMPSADPLA